MRDARARVGGEGADAAGLLRRAEGGGCKQTSCVQTQDTHKKPSNTPRTHTPGDAKYLAWYREVSLRTARLVAGWQAVGFVHGVLNTNSW